MRWCSIFLIALWTGLMVASAQTDKPRIVFESTTKDAGTVSQGEVLKKVFTFSNKGPGVLEITDIRSS